MFGILKIKSVYDSIKLRHKQTFIEGLRISGIKGMYMKEYEGLKSTYRTSTCIEESKEFITADSLECIFKPFIRTIKEVFECSKYMRIRSKFLNKM